MIINTYKADSGQWFAWVTVLLTAINERPVVAHYSAATNTCRTLELPPGQEPNDFTVHQAYSRGTHRGPIVHSALQLLLKTSVELEIRKGLQPVPSKLKLPEGWLVRVVRQTDEQQAFIIREHDKGPYAVASIDDEQPAKRLLALLLLQTDLEP